MTVSSPMRGSGPVQKLGVIGCGIEQLLAALGEEDPCGMLGVVCDAVEVT